MRKQEADKFPASPLRQPATRPLKLGPIRKQSLIRQNLGHNAIRLLLSIWTVQALIESLVSVRLQNSYFFHCGNNINLTRNQQYHRRF